MTFNLSFSRRAANYLRRMDRESQERMAVAFRILCEDPLVRRSKPLRDPAGRRAFRVGGWRIIYFIDDQNYNVHVDMIGPRGEVYREL
ncbi:MAG TPA: type II toxin-antitoxin system RelE/ParE family toxin [Tepidiformaceae bacterium]|nr:type II toxin-antitoxin system RelE/ParE family toxin [Tepidiformaceae bacterium]